MLTLVLVCHSFATALMSGIFDTEVLMPFCSDFILSRRPSVRSVYPPLEEFWLDVELEFAVLDQIPVCDRP